MHHFYNIPPARAKHNPIEQQTKRALAQLERLRIAGKSESSALEPLREQAESGPIPVDRLQQSPSTVREDVHATGEWIIAEGVLHKGHEPVERLPHIDGVAIGQDPPHVAGEDQGSAFEPQMAPIGE